MTSQTPAHKFVQQLLEPWPQHSHRFELRAGKKHDHLLLDGRTVLVLPRTPKSNGHRVRNAAALLKRLLRC